jgi:glyoxylase-like metal-dependent hydrolase (beta-lactamase superfamily II)
MAPVPARLTPLSGARADGAPLAHLLELGPPDATLTLLLDCGWSPADGDPEACLRPLLEALPRVDAVLLSHADTRHAGALPVLVGRHKLGAPVFGTAPVARMGVMFAYDAYLSAQVRSDTGEAGSRGPWHGAPSGIGARALNGRGPRMALPAGA